MKVKDLLQHLANVDPELSIVVFECHKHDDNAPLMEVNDIGVIERVNQPLEDADTVLCLYMNANPDTVSK